MVSGNDWPDGAWCFPQGGINFGETHIEALKRELREELGTNKFEIVGKSQKEHMYLFPEELRAKKGCEGQFQTIWFVEFKGEFEEIDHDEEELKKHSWFEKEDVVPNMMYDEQKETFKEVLKEFAKLKEDKIF